MDMQSELPQCLSRGWQTLVWLFMFLQSFSGTAYASSDLCKFWTAFILPFLFVSSLHTYLFTSLFCFLQSKWGSNAYISIAKSNSCFSRSLNATHVLWSEELNHQNVPLCFLSGNQEKQLTHFQKNPNFKPGLFFFLLNFFFLQLLLHSSPPH